MGVFGVRSFHASQYGSWLLRVEPWRRGVVQALMSERVPIYGFETVSNDQYSSIRKKLLSFPNENIQDSQRCLLSKVILLENILSLFILIALSQAASNLFRGLLLFSAIFWRRVVKISRFGTFASQVHTYSISLSNLIFQHLKSNWNVIAVVLEKPKKVSPRLATGQI